MRKSFYYLVVFVFTLTCSSKLTIAQSGMLFHKMFIPTTDIFYESGEYQKSIENSLQNDKLTIPDLYRIAQCYALLNVSDSAYFYLNRFIDTVIIDCRVVLIDDDFEILRKNNAEWAKIKEKIESKFLDSLAKSANKEYALALFRLGVERMKYSYFDVSFDKSEKLATNQIWKKQSKVIKDFDKLVRKYGFPTQLVVGEDALYSSIEIILHPPIKEKNYLMLQKAFEEREYLPAHYAWITDRWLTQNGKLQMYGTLFSYQQNSDGSSSNVLMPVEDFANLNKRRAEIGLQTIEEDLKVFGGKIPEEYYGGGCVKNTTYHISNGIYFEIPDDTVSPERFTSDNLIYKSNNVYEIKYTYLNKDGQKLYYKIDHENLDSIESFDTDRQIKRFITIPRWKFVSADSIDENTIVLIKLFIEPDFGSFSYIPPNYRQSVIRYEYISNSGKVTGRESTGLVENQNNIWMHPPREKLFRILELNPFPYVKLDSDISSTFNWEMTVGEQWGDPRWKTWEGGITIKFSYENKERKNVSTEFYNNIDCMVTESTGESTLGTTKLISYFNEELGFIKLEYTNIDGSTIILEYHRVYE